MLTSYHYLLGGIMTVSCATGSVAHSVAVSQMSPISFEQRQRELIQVSDRGSGRLGDRPATQRSRPRIADCALEHRPFRLYSQ